LKSLNEETENIDLKNYLSEHVNA